MERSDNEIIARVQQGDRDAYLELFERYYPRVERYARWRVGNREAALDIASDTFLRAFRAVGKYRPDRNASYLAYLLAICHRLAATESSRRRRAGDVGLDESWRVLDGRADDSDPPIVGILDRERDAIVRGAIDALPEDDREIILLAFEQGISRADIAQIMGKPTVSAVTSHLHRAMSKLRAAVQRIAYFAPTEAWGGQRQ